jgi:hypothetical protein
LNVDEAIKDVTIADALKMAKGHIIVEESFD